METSTQAQRFIDISRALRDCLTGHIVGQKDLVDALQIALLSGGHILLEGVPGIGKTFAANVLAHAIQATFQRIQFTPDLLPSDLIGSEVFIRDTAQFVVKKGPLFTHILLADEINRAPAKVQSALLEVMQEHTITIGDTTFPIEAPFLVIATQNPIEQEGTYPLPEAQLDRFLLHVSVGYPTEEEEIAICRSADAREDGSIESVISIADVLQLQEYVRQNIYVDDKIYRYVKDIVFATRQPQLRGLANIASYIALGASPRASIGMVRAAKSVAFLAGRDYIIPEDIKRVAPYILRHRIILSFEAIGRGISPDEIIQTILSETPIA